MSADEATPADAVLELSRRALALVLADISRTTCWNPVVRLEPWMDGDVRISVDGGFGTPPSVWQRTEPEVIAEIADYMQEMLDQNPSIWPVCGKHDVGLHAEVRERTAVWWCRLGRHVVSEIGRLNAADCAPQPPFGPLD